MLHPWLQRQLLYTMALTHVDCVTTNCTSLLAADYESVSMVCIAFLGGALWAACVALHMVRQREQLEVHSPREDANY
jgi:hypothetical protein